MVGSGALAGWLIKAHCTVRPIEQITIWNRNEAGAVKLAKQLQDEGFNASATTDLQKAVETSDIISAATMAIDPLIRGEWLKPGTHIDLVGGFKPDMREADDEAIRRSSVFVDTFDGAPERGRRHSPTSGRGASSNGLTSWPNCPISHVCEHGGRLHQ